MLALAPLALTLMPYWRTSRGWVRMWDFPRVQITALGLLAKGLLWRWGRGRAVDRLLSTGLTGVVAYQAAKIAPYTPLYPKEVPWTAEPRPDRRLRLLMINVRQRNRRDDLVRRAVRDGGADVVCIVEADDWWTERLEPVLRDYSWVARCPLDNAYGMLLCSRLAVRDAETRFVVQPDIPSIRASVELPCGDEVIVYAVHPRPPLPDTASWGRDAELVLTGLEARDDDTPAVVIGDLNDVAWSYTTTLFQRLSHMADPRVGRGTYNTFHAEHPLSRYPLDHVFHTPDFTVSEIRRLGYTGSDHFPILIELALVPSRRGEVVQPTASSGDLARANAIVGEAEARETDGPAPRTGASDPDVAGR